MTNAEDKTLGCILGLAIGDAIGFPTEFLSLDSMDKRRDPSGSEWVPN